MSDLWSGWLPLCPAPYPSHTHGSTQRVGNSEPEETVREDEGKYEKRITSITSSKERGF